MSCQCVFPCHCVRGDKENGSLRCVCVGGLGTRLNDIYTCIYAFKRYDNNKKKADRFILKENEKRG